MDSMPELVNKLDDKVSFTAIIRKELGVADPVIVAVELNKASKNPVPVPGTGGNILTTDFVRVTPLVGAEKLLVEIFEGANGRSYQYKNLIHREARTVEEAIQDILA